jgi:hypothetical protein
VNNPYLVEQTMLLMKITMLFTTDKHVVFLYQTYLANKNGPSKPIFILDEVSYAPVDRAPIRDTPPQSEPR